MTMDNNDRIYKKLDDLNENVLKMMGRQDSLEEVQKQLGYDVWGRSEESPGLKTNVDRIMQAEKAKIWWLRIIIGTTATVAVERIVAFFKVAKKAIE